MKHLRFIAVTIALGTTTGLVGCVPNNSSGSEIRVESSATACSLSANSASSGTVTFVVTNTGDETTEFYVLKDDGQTVAGEVENIGPGLTRNLVMSAEPGAYYTVCKPGMTGAGIGNAIFTVTENGSAAGTSAEDQALIDSATANYAAYVREQIGELVTGTAAFAAAYASGDFDQARALYAPTRAHWERVETVAESFGDLDPKLDLREADLEAGQEWTGWHAIEKDLWPQDAEPGFVAYTPTQRQLLADQLVADTATLNERVQDLTFTLSQLTNGAIGLIDEVASTKLTGEEEIWSHTDLWAVQANVDGAYVLFQEVLPLLSQRDEALATQLASEFDGVNGILDGLRAGDGFIPYDKLSKQQVKALSDQVNALAEPLNTLTAVLLNTK